MNTTDKSLYEITGDIKDINTLLVNRAEIDALVRKAYEAGWTEAAKWADRCDLIADIGSQAFDRGFDAAMQEKQS